MDFTFVEGLTSENRVGQPCRLYCRSILVTTADCNTGKHKFKDTSLS